MKIFHGVLEIWSGQEKVPKGTNYKSSKDRVMSIVHCSFLQCDQPTYEA